MSDVVPQVIRVLQQSQPLPAGVRLQSGTVLMEGGLNFDSVALLEFVIALEAEFGCEIDDSEITGGAFRTVGTASELIESKLEPRDPT